MFPFGYSYIFGQQKFRMGKYTSDNALHKKVAWQGNGRLSKENFDAENLDELIKIHQIHQHFPPSNFASYGSNSISTCL